jgi:ornithine cyclodeaminase/alanine dehydrogenase-like protein (mu-crystallin family)
MPPAQVLYLSRHDIESLDLGLLDIISALERAFGEKAAGKTAMPVKHWIERSPDTFYSAMTSYIPSLRAAGCKWQSGDPRNTERGLSYILGLYILNDDETGLPVAIMDSTWLTAMRTAAASALTAKYLAADAHTVAILGCGVQGRANLDALKLTIPAIESCLAYDIKPEIAAQYSHDMSSRLGISVQSVSTAREAVRGSQIIVTAGPIKHPADPVIQDDWIPRGALAIALDYDSYWTPAAVGAMDYLVTDDIQQLDHLKESGFFLAVSHVDSDLAEVVTRQKLVTRPAAARILAFNLGVAIEDLATAVELYRLARERGVGTLLPL